MTKRCRGRGHSWQGLIVSWSLEHKVFLTRGKFQKKCLILSLDL